MGDLSNLRHMMKNINQKHAEENNSFIKMPVILDQKQAAKYLSVSTQWLERDRWKGPSIPYFKVGRMVRYKTSDILKYLQSNYVEPNPPSATEQ